MNKYTNFFGIDIAKNEFVIAMRGQKKTKSYSNDTKGFSDFTNQHQAELQGALVILEATGGHEWDFMSHLMAEKIFFHRADTLKVKRFNGSIRHFGKTDAIDAHCLATYGFERHASLPLFKAKEESELRLQLLVRRREELVADRTQEINRSKSPMSKLISVPASYSNMIEAFDEQIKAVDDAMQQLIESDPEYEEKKKLMMQMPGIGELTATKLLGLFIELGTLSRRNAASLAGLAPHPFDSGQHSGYRRTRGGRTEIKKAMYMPAMAASQSKGKLGDYYRMLLAKGKKKKVALVALMRKMIIILNAQIRDMLAQKRSSILPV
jgi:transposase